jgi:hypothetical protein
LWQSHRSSMKNGSRPTAMLGERGVQPAPAHRLQPRSVRSQSAVWRAPTETWCKANQPCLELDNN